MPDLLIPFLIFDFLVIALFIVSYRAEKNFDRTMKEMINTPQSIQK